MGRGVDERRRRFERLRGFDRRFDPEAWEGGLLAGVDEVGVGPLAGPVVAAAVILPADFDLPELFDSKQMTAKARRACEREVRSRAVALGLARVSPARIDRLNIRRAMFAAHRRALSRLAVQPRSVIIDGKWMGRMPPGWEAVRVETVVGGDARSLAVAAASVVAKEVRDRIMRRLDRRYPQYGFARHKGYATADHRQAVRDHGLSPEHRQSFCGWVEAERELARQGVLSFDPAG
jgi:ribonuclease HII